MTDLNDRRTNWRYLATASIVVAFTAVLIWLAFTLLAPDAPAIGNHGDGS